MARNSHDRPLWLESVIRLFLRSHIRMFWAIGAFCCDLDSVRAGTIQHMAQSDFIIVAVIATNLFLESFVPARMGIMNSLSYLQIPQCGTDQPLTISLLKQLIYFSAALGLFIITALFRFLPQCANG